MNLYSYFTFVFIYIIARLRVSEPVRRGTQIVTFFTKLKLAFERCIGTNRSTCKSVRVFIEEGTCRVRLFAIQLKYILI